jgi:hypothetical protein
VKDTNYTNRHEYVSCGGLKLLPWWDPLHGELCFEKIVASLGPQLANGVAGMSPASAAADTAASTVSIGENPRHPRLPSHFPRNARPNLTEYLSERPEMTSQ